MNFYQLLLTMYYRIARMIRLAVFSIVTLYIIGTFVLCYFLSSCSSPQAITTETRHDSTSLAKQRDSLEVQNNKKVYVLIDSIKIASPPALPRREGADSSMALLRSFSQALAAPFLQRADSSMALSRQAVLALAAPSLQRADSSMALLRQAVLALAAPSLRGRAGGEAAGEIAGEAAGEIAGEAAAAFYGVKVLATDSSLLRKTSTIESSIAVSQVNKTTTGAKPPDSKSNSRSHIAIILLTLLASFSIIFSFWYFKYRHA